MLVLQCMIRNACFAVHHLRCLSCNACYTMLVLQCMIRNACFAVLVLLVWQRSFGNLRFLQGDQIWLFLRDPGNNIAYNSIPNLWQLSGLFWNFSLFEQNVLWLRFGHILDKLGYFLFKHPVTLGLLTSRSFVYLRHKSIRKLFLAEWTTRVLREREK